MVRTMTSNSCSAGCWCGACCVSPPALGIGSKGEMIPLLWRAGYLALEPTKSKNTEFAVISERNPCGTHGNEAWQASLDFCTVLPANDRKFFVGV